MKFTAAIQHSFISVKAENSLEPQNISKEKKRQHSSAPCGFFTYMWEIIRRKLQKPFFKVHVAWLKALQRCKEKNSWKVFDAKFLCNLWVKIQLQFFITVLRRCYVHGCWRCHEVFVQSKWNLITVFSSLFYHFNVIKRYSMSAIVAHWKSFEWKILKLWGNGRHCDYKW